VNRRPLTELGRPACIALALVIVLLLPVALGLTSSTVQLLNEILSFTVLAIGMNIAAGFAGQFLLGLSAVFAVGGYSAAEIASHQPSTGFVGMAIAAVIVGTAAGILVGLPALRVSGFYLGVVTLFAAVVVPLIATNSAWLGGATGIALFAIPGFNPALTTSDQYYAFIAIVLVLTIGSGALLRSRLGHRFQVLASSEELAASLGVSAYRTKMAAVIIASAIASLGGAMYVYSQQFFSPDSAGVTLSILVLAAVVIGGLGSVSGPLVGSAFVFGLNTFLNFQQYDGIVFGALVLIFVLFAPRGLVPEIARAATALRLPEFHWRRVPRAVPAQAQAEALATIAPARGEAGRELLVISDVHRAFGGVRAVDGVSLTVCQGELHGLIGSNGSGKTTLLNLVSGFYYTESGQIRLGGQVLERMRPYRRAVAGVTRTFQTPKLMDHQTVLDNVIAGAELKLRVSHLSSALRLPAGRRASRQAEETAISALDELGLTGVAGATAGLLPHGTRRLVELARAIAMNPSVLLVDEPAAGLSEAELGTLSDALRTLAARGVAVCLIEHNVPMVLRLATSVTALHQGRVLFQGTPDQLRSDKDVAMAFLGSFSGVADQSEDTDHELI
jgi:branched-chain amino acid transport system permease protein